MLPTPWQEALIDIDRATEFGATDDVDRYSKLVTLPMNYEFITVIIPALSTSGIVSVYVQRDAELDTVPVIVHTFDADQTGSFAHSTSSGAGAIVVIFRIGGFQHLRIHVSENQSADRTFYVRGFDGG